MGIAPSLVTLFVGSRASVGIFAIVAGITLPRPIRVSELRSDVEVATEQTRIEIEVNLSWYLCGGGDELGVGIVKTDGEIGHTIEHLPDR